MVGVGVASSLPFVVVGVGVASSLSSVFVLHCRRSLLSVAHRCPSFFRIRCALLNCLALGEVESAGCRIILGRRRWWCRVSCVRASSCIPGWSYVVFVSAGRCLGCCVLRTSVFPLWGGQGHLLGSCCSWTAGIVSAGQLHVMLHGGDIVAKWTWVVVGRFVEVVGGIAGVVVVD